MTSREIIFGVMPGSRISGRELHFTVSDDKCVEWQVIPRGEKGCSLPFADLQEAERFIQNYALRLGFPRRLADADSAEAELPT